MPVQPRLGKEVEDLASRKVLAARVCTVQPLGNAAVHPNCDTPRPGTQTAKVQRLLARRADANRRNQEGRTALEAKLFTRRDN